MRIKYIKSNQIEKMNQVNKSTHVVPNYNISRKKVHAEFYISPDRKLLMIGRIDNNYIFWLSMSTLEEKEKNAKIFNTIVNNSHYYVSTLAKVLGKQYEEVKGWMKGELRRTSVGGMLWQTPFGHFYGMENQEEHGRCFANDIYDYFDTQQELCNIRIANGAYEEILVSYLEILQKEDSDYMYYEQMKPLISILEQERYLILCPEEKIRNLYFECLKQVEALYNAYMTVVR